MHHVTATDFKTRFGEYATLAQQEPVAVLRGAKPIGVFVSPEEYDHLQRLDDAYWAAQAAAAVERGDFLSPEDTMRWVSERLAGTE